MWRPRDLRPLTLVPSSPCLPAAPDPRPLLSPAPCLLPPRVRSKRPFLVRSLDDVVTASRHMHADALAPIFLTSSVTGQGLDLVRLWYNLLPRRHNWCARPGWAGTRCPVSKRCLPLLLWHRLLRGEERAPVGSVAKPGACSAAASDWVPLPAAP